MFDDELVVRPLTAAMPVWPVSALLLGQVHCLRSLALPLVLHVAIRSFQGIRCKRRQMCGRRKFEPVVRK